MAPKREAKKGKRILFIAGSYDGLKGWIDLGQDEMPKMIGVIVEGKRPGDELKVTKVKQSSVRDVSARKNAESYEEALLEQHPDIEALMEKLARELARCEITGKGESANEILSLVKKKIQKAYNNQSLLGQKARWRKVKWDDILDLDDDEAENVDDSSM